MAPSPDEAIVWLDNGSDEGCDACVNDGSDDGRMTSFNGSNTGRDTLFGNGSSEGGVACVNGRFGTVREGGFDPASSPGSDGGLDPVSNPGFDGGPDPGSNEE